MAIKTPNDLRAEVAAERVAVQLAQSIRIRSRSKSKAADTMRRRDNDTTVCAVMADGILDVFKEAGLKDANIALLSDEFLTDVRNMKQKNLAVEALRKLLSGEVKARQRSNIVQSRRFSERLEDAIARYHNRAVDSIQVIQELIDLAKEMQAATARGHDFGLSPEEMAFYDALAENESAVNLLGNETLRVLAQEVAKRIRASVTIDWVEKQSVHARMRIEVKRLLKQFGYPPDLSPKAIELVLEQARNLGDTLVS